MGASASLARLPQLLRINVAALMLVAVAACDLVPVEDAKPTKPSGPTQQSPTGPSDSSIALQRYYARAQNDMLVRGLLRQDGGGPDTPFTATDLARNFEQIAFYDEYARGSGLSRGGGVQAGLRRWGGPVRIAAKFGASVSVDQRTKDIAEVSGYAARLSRITGHPISYTDSNPNFHVFFLSEDDRPDSIEDIRRIVPGISETSLNIFRDIPRSIHCLVAAFSENGNEQNYTTAIAVIRAEHPALLRRSCVHEELAQGLGLANDSPAARPSIFNDDDEFALLTSHDELLLKMLYDPRLKQSMSLEQASPIAYIIARELVDGDL
ncbi:MAG: DUF2927 domain-containing protein [Paracoccaceae bacterium]